MSLGLIRSVMNTLPTTQAWMVSLVKIKNSRRNGTTYATRGITLSPQGALTRFVTDLSKVYTEGEKGLVNKYTAVVDYDGSAEAIKIYKLQSNNQLIAEEYTHLIQAMSAPEMNGDPFEFAANAYALKATLTIDDEDRSIMLFSLQNPICVLKNRFLYDNNTFFELNKKVLNLRQNIDVMIIDDTVYLLTLAGEKLFNMERSYKAVCEDKAMEICQSDIVSDIDQFRTIATSGHNPRRFVSFNQARFDRMKEPETRIQMAGTFRLTLDANGHIDTSSPDMIEKLIKVLCNKGMVDPFDNVPVEVSGASRW